MCCTIVLLLAAAITAADPRPGAEGTPDYTKAAELVKQLGHARYATREAAAKELLEMGPAAVPALAAGAKSADEEVRNRSIALLPQSKAVEWRRRAAAYLADVDGKEKHDLPLLAEFAKLIVKPDAGSRKLFADMVKAGGDLLEQAAADRKAGAAVCAARCKGLLAQVRTPKGQIKAELGDVAAILFVDTLTVTNKDWSSAHSANRLLLNPTAVEALGAADTGPAFRQLLARWAEARPAKDPVAFLQFAAVAMKEPFPEAVPVLIGLARDKSGHMLFRRLVAIQTLGRVGGKEAAAALADLVGDPTPVFGDAAKYQLGDAALAAAVTLAGKALADYGLTHYGSTEFSPGEGYGDLPLVLYGFPNADARAKALRKWKDETAKK